EESHLRENLVDGLLRRVEHNWAHGVRSIRLYEVGTVFSPVDRVPGEEIHLAAVLTGPASPPHWSTSERPWDIWDLKALAEDVAGVFGGGVTVDDSGGTVGRLLLTGPDGRQIGAASEVEAARLDAPAWAQPVFALEVLLQPLSRSVAPRFEPLPEF